MRLIRTGLPFLRFRSYEIDKGAQIVIEAFGFVLFMRNPTSETFCDFAGMKQRGEIVRKGNRWARV